MDRRLTWGLGGGIVLLLLVLVVANLEERRRAEPFWHVAGTASLGRADSWSTTVFYERGYWIYLNLRHVDGAGAGAEVLGGESTCRWPSIPHVTTACTVERGTARLRLWSDQPSTVAYEAWAIDERYAHDFDPPPPSSA